MTTALTDLRTVEVSLVRRGANGRTYALAKRAPEKPMPEPTATPETQATVTETPAPEGTPVATVEPAAVAPDAPVTDTPAAAAEPTPAALPEPVAKMWLEPPTPVEEALMGDTSALTGNAKSAIAMAARLLTEYAKELPEDAFERVAMMCGKPKPSTVAKAAPATDVESVAKSMPELVAKAYRESVEKAARLEAEVTKMHRAEKLRASVAKAQTMPHLGMSAETLGEVLLALDESGLPVAKTLTDLLERASTALANSPLLEEVGKSNTGGATGGTALERVNALATTIHKAEGGTHAEAVTKALTRNPHLYTEFENERTAAQAV